MMVNSVLTFVMLMALNILMEPKSEVRSKAFGDPSSPSGQSEAPATGLVHARGISWYDNDQGLFLINMVGICRPLVVTRACRFVLIKFYHQFAKALKCGILVARTMGHSALS